jgi:hypothetical protein
MSYVDKVEMKEGSIDWMYPEIYGKDEPRSILKIGLYHVRAADDIEIEYDSDRDGYVIYQTVTVGYKLEPEGKFLEPVEKRKEKAFIPAWDDEQVMEPE